MSTINSAQKPNKLRDKLRKWSYYRLTDIRDSQLCPEWLEWKIDDLRYSDYYREFWEYD